MPGCMMARISRGLYLLMMVVGSHAFNVHHVATPACHRTTRIHLDSGPGARAYRPPALRVRCAHTRRGRGPGVALCAKRKIDRDDPEYQAVLARQKVLTEAMDVLTKYDEAQVDFTSKHADSNAPLGDWCGYHKRLTAVERETMREACKTLASEAAYVLVGLNAPDLEAARLSLDQWLEGLGLPPPDRVPYTDDTLRQEYETIDEMQAELQELFAGPIHMCYNSVAGADWETGDDTGFPPAAHAMPYPAGDRGVVFTPILEGFFTQYGDIPLDLFDATADAHAPSDEEAAREAAERTLQSDPDIMTRQHAALGNPMAARALATGKLVGETQAPADSLAPPETGPG